MKLEEIVSTPNHKIGISQHEYKRKRSQLTKMLARYFWQIQLRHLKLNSTQISLKGSWTL